MRRKKQWICNFIALFALILGVCAFETGADSVFVCQKTALSCKKSADALLFDTDTQNAESLCTSSVGIGNQIVAQITGGRKTIKPLPIFLGVATASLLLSKFYETERVAEFKELYSRAVVLDFIHNTDGKK